MRRSIGMRRLQTKLRRQQRGVRLSGSAVPRASQTLTAWPCIAAAETSRNDDKVKRERHALRRQQYLLAGSGELRQRHWRLRLGGCLRRLGMQHAIAEPIGKIAGRAALRACWRG